MERRRGPVAAGWARIHIDSAIEEEPDDLGLPAHAGEDERLLDLVPVNLGCMECIVESGDVPGTAERRSIITFSGRSIIFGDVIGVIATLSRSGNWPLQPSFGTHATLNNVGQRVGSVSCARLTARGWASPQDRLGL